MENINYVTPANRSDLLVTTKIRAGVYRIVDRMDNRYDVERTGEHFDGDQWHLFRDTGGYEREYWNTFVTKNDAMDAIIRQYRTLLAEQEAHEAESAKIAPKKVILKVCEHCGIEYEAERNSSRFHSAQCRVAHNRKIKRDKKNRKPDIFELIREIGHGIAEKDTAYQSAITLINLQKAIEMYLPNGTRWWHCDNCHTGIMKFVPTSKDCSCGDNARWFIMNTGSK